MSRPTISLVNFDNADSQLEARTNLFVRNLTMKGRKNIVYGVGKANMSYLIAGAWFNIMNVPKELFNLISKNKVDWDKVEEIIDKDYL